LLPRFTAELEAVAGVVYRAAEFDIPSLVSRIAKERQLSRVVTWSESALGLPRLLAGLQAEGLEVEDGSPSVGVPPDPKAVEGIRHVLARAELGLTGVDYAVAASGSLVLVSGRGKGRLVSCLPTVHVAILRPGQLVETLEEVGVLFEDFHRQHPPGNPPSSITFITGPSRTADIELSLTRGVHGPKEVHVIALDR
jgi:L-lactate dehydrogenase complex protein LldG